MTPRLRIILFLVVLSAGIKAQQIVAGFLAPDTVCVNQTFTIQNTTTGPANTWYWNFCMANTGVAPTPTNLGNFGGFNGPVYYTIGKDGTNYYAFVVNNWGGTLTRLFYGSSLMNTPVATNLGSFGGIIPISIEDIHLELEAGNWFGIMTGGSGGASRVIRLSFGASLGNMPTAVNMGNIGGLNYPQRIQVFKSGGNVYGFTPNLSGNSITRFNFGASIGNTPTGINLGNIGALSQPDDIAIINFAGNWYGWIVNEVSNTLTRLDFGTSLLNTPTGVNLGNTGALNGPRGIDVWVECGTIKGLIVNRYGNDLVNMNFSAGPTGPLTTTSFGNIANFSFPHSIKRFRSGDTLFAMIPNVNNSTLSRIYYASCVNSSIPSSTLQTPPAISYNQPGTYYINLVVNETQINKSDYCKKVVVVAPPTVAITGNTSVCSGSAINLSGFAPPGCTFQWTGPNGFTATTQNIAIPNSSTLASGTYTLIASKGLCSSTLAVHTVSVGSSQPVNLGSDISLCTPPFSATLNAQNPGSTYQWSTGQTTQTIQVTGPGTYSVQVTSLAGCTSTGQINVTSNSLNVNLGNDFVLCPGSVNVLNAGSAGASYTWSTGETTQTIQINSPGTYSVMVSNNGCSGSDVVTVTSVSLNLGNDQAVCDGNPVTLNAGNAGATYTWNTGANSQTINVTSGGTYWVSMSVANCIFSDSVNVVIKPSPVVNLGSDKIFCKNDLIALTLNAGNSGASYNWNTSASTQTIFVNSPGTYSVAVTGTNGCITSDNIVIALADLNPDLGRDTSFCVDGAMILFANTPATTYLWNTGAITSSIAVSSSGTYWVEATIAGCSVRDSIFLGIHAKPTLNVQADTVLCIGDVIVLSVANYSPGYQIWSTGSTANSINVTIPGSYYVTASVNGCIVSDEIHVEDCDSEIWLPNAFTPDQDGRNEIFAPKYYNIQNVELLIFNRWGEEIFKGEGEKAGWDGMYKGKMSQEGIYTCMVNYKQRGKQKQLIGKVALLKTTGGR